MLGFFCRALSAGFICGAASWTLWYVQIFVGRGRSRPPDRRDGVCGGPVLTPSFLLSDSLSTCKYFFCGWIDLRQPRLFSRRLSGAILVSSVSVPRVFRRHPSVFISRGCTFFFFSYPPFSPDCGIDDVGGHRRSRTRRILTPRPRHSSVRAESFLDGHASQHLGKCFTPPPSGNAALFFSFLQWNKNSSFAERFLVKVLFVRVPMWCHEVSSVFPQPKTTPLAETNGTLSSIVLVFFNVTLLAGCIEFLFPDPRGHFFFKGLGLFS